MVKSTPYFSVEPSSGAVMPGGTAQVMVRYHPKAMGKHSGKIPVQVRRGAGARWGASHKFQRPLD